MTNSVFISSLQHPVHHSWKKFLTEEMMDLLGRIEEKIFARDRDYSPDAERVLRFFQVPMDDIKIIILGQDPYPQKDVATGRAFEVGTLKSWNEKYSNVSLKNIVRSIHTTYTGKTLKYNEIFGTACGDFQISPPGKLFSSWENQGVLLLNTSFTVEIGKPESHSDIWKEFTASLLQFLATEKPDLIWFLWGNHAKQISKDLPIRIKFISQHPMMCYAGPDRKDDFLFGTINPFKKTMHLVDWRGQKNQSLFLSDT